MPIYMGLEIIVTDSLLLMNESKHIRKEFKYIFAILQCVWVKIQN